jgi:hypothetical protein
MTEITSYKLPRGSTPLGKTDIFLDKGTSPYCVTLTSTIECRTSAKTPVSFLLLRNNKIIAVIEKIFDLSGDVEIHYDDKDVQEGIHEYKLIADLASDVEVPVCLNSKLFVVSASWIGI